MRGLGAACAEGCDAHPAPGKWMSKSGRDARAPSLPYFFAAASASKYRMSGGRWPFLAGIRRPSALFM
jgi:hypothetical protein